MHMLHHGLITVGPLETNELVMRNNNTISGNNMQGFINHPFIRPGKLLIRVVSSVFYLSSSTQTHVPLPVRRWNDAVACETKPMSQPQRHIEGMFKKAVSFFWNVSIVEVTRKKSRSISTFHEWSRMDISHSCSYISVLFSVKLTISPPGPIQYHINSVLPQWPILHEGRTPRTNPWPSKHRIVYVLEMTYTIYIPYTIVMYVYIKYACR